MFFLARNCPMLRVLWAGALSWESSQFVQPQLISSQAFSKANTVAFLCRFADWSSGPVARTVDDTFHIEQWITPVIFQTDLVLQSDNITVLFHGPLTLKAWNAQHYYKISSTKVSMHTKTQMLYMRLILSICTHLWECTKADRYLFLVYNMFTIYNKRFPNEFLPYFCSWQTKILLHFTILLQWQSSL